MNKSSFPAPPSPAFKPNGKKRDAESEKRDAESEKRDAESKEEEHYWVCEISPPISRQADASATGQAQHKVVQQKETVVHVRTSSGKESVLSSRYHPRKEAERIVSTVSEKDRHLTTLVVLLGAGNFSLVKLARKHFDSAQLLVVAKHRSLLMLCQEYFQTREKLQNCKYLCEDGEATVSNASAKGTSIRDKQHGYKAVLKAYFKQHKGIGRNILFLQNQKEVHWHPDFFSEVRQAIVDNQNEKAINKNTFHRFEHIWFANLCANTKDITRSIPLVNLLEAGKEGHALLLGAGPSLEADLPTIKKLQHKAYLIAPDTSVRPLLSRGIMPDAIASVDPQKINSRYIENLPQHVYEQVVLFTDPAVCPASIRRFHNVVMFDSFFPYYRLLAAFYGSKGEINAGGSVASAAYELARAMAFSTITLAGVDLSFHKESYHVGGSLYEEQWLSECSRFSTFEMKIHRLFSFEDLQIKKNIVGEDVYVDSPLSLYKNWFDKTTKNPFTAKYNVSQTGLEINGFTSLKIEDWETVICAKHRDSKGGNASITDQKAKIIETIHQRIQAVKTNNQLNAKTIDDRFKKILKQTVYTLEETAEKLKQGLAGFDRNKGMAIERLQKTADGITKNTILRDLISATMQKTIDRINDDYDKENAKGNFHLLCKDMLKSCQLNHKLLSRVVKQYSRVKQIEIQK